MQNLPKELFILFKEDNGLRSIHQTYAVESKAKSMMKSGNDTWKEEKFSVQKYVIATPPEPKWWTVTTEHNRWIESFTSLESAMEYMHTTMTRYPGKVCILSPVTEKEDEPIPVYRVYDTTGHKPVHLDSFTTEAEVDAFIERKLMANSDYTYAVEYDKVMQQWRPKKQASYVGQYMQGSNPGYLYRLYPPYWVDGSEAGIGNGYRHALVVETDGYLGSNTYVFAARGDGTVDQYEPLFVLENDEDSRGALRAFGYTPTDWSWKEKD